MAPPSDSFEENNGSDTDDLIDELRSQFSDDELEDSDTPAGPLEEPEPDFTVGQPPVEEQPSTDVAAQPPSADVPAWLAETSAPRPASQPTTPIPDWLGEAGAPPPAPETMSPVPDWLSQAGAPPSGPPAAPPVAPEPPSASAAEEPPVSEDEAEIPGWMREMDVLSEETQPEEPASEPEPFGGQPAWLDDLATESSSEESIEDVEQTAPADDEVPAWLMDEIRSEVVDAAETPSDEEPVAEAEAEDAPDWFAELDEEEQPAEEAAFEEMAAPSEEEMVPEWMSELSAEAEPSSPPVEEASSEEAPPAEEEAVPGWMADLSAESEPVPSEEAPEDEKVRYTPPPDRPDFPAPLIDTGMPEWLEKPQLEGTPPAESTDLEAEDVAAPEAGEEAVPDWLAGLSAEEAPQPAEAEEPSPPVEEEEAVPDWMSDLGADAELPVPAAEETAVDELPLPAEEAADELDWLDDMAPEPVAETEGDDEDWFDTFDFESDMAEAAPAEAGEDLLGLSGDLAMPAAEEEEALEEEEIPEAEAGEMPEWLRGVRQEAGYEAEGRPPMIIGEGMEDLSPEKIEQLEDLRYASIAGRLPRIDAEHREAVGALKDISGVIQPELIFEGSTLTVDDPIDHPIVTDSQSERINRLTRLLESEAEGTAISRDRRGQIPVGRLLVALAILLAVIVPVVMDLFILPAPTPSTEVTTVYTAIENLSAAGSNVLVAFEYEPDSAAEMEPLAEAVVWHLSRSPDVTVYAVSTLPTGPAMADHVFIKDAISPRLADNDGTWRNLGYISGGANGVSGLAIGTPSGVTSPFAFDHFGQPTDIQATSLNDVDIDAIIVFAARPEHLRIWVEQAGKQTGIPIIAAVSASARPLARPYRDTEQVEAVISGLTDAVAYWKAGDMQVGRSLLSRWNAQAIGAGAAAVLIIIGAVVNGVSHLRRRQEQIR